MFLRQKAKLNLSASVEKGSKKLAKRQANRDKRVSLLPHAATQQSTRRLWMLPGEQAHGEASTLARAFADDDARRLAQLDRRPVVSEAATVRRQRQESEALASAERLLATARVAAHLPLVVRLQALMRARLARQQVARMRQREAKRRQVAEELLETERSYVAGIKLMVSAYKVPLENQVLHEESRDTGGPAGVLSKGDIKKLFMNIEDICEESDKLLYALDSRVSNIDVATRIGDVFIKLVPSLGALLCLQRRLPRVATALPPPLGRQTLFGVDRRAAHADVGPEQSRLYFALDHADSARSGATACCCRSC